MSELFLFGVEAVEDEEEALQADTAPYGSDEEEEEEEWEASWRETEEVEDDREKEVGRSPSEQTVLTEVQDDEEAPRSPDDIILPTIPLRDEVEEGCLAPAGKQMTMFVCQQNHLTGWILIKL